jgi:hypothetical protein
MLTDGDREALADGWRVWNADDTRAILAYRPDVFDGSGFDPACMPTVYVVRGRRTRRPGGTQDLPPDAPWTVTLYLEPSVKRDPEFHDTPREAVEAALSLAARFGEGEVDYRGLYQVPREAYFEELDRLTGRGDDRNRGRES